MVISPNPRRRPLFTRLDLTIERVTELVCDAAHSPAYAGPASGDDGDTLQAGLFRIRLADIDAPERCQTCWGPLAS